MNDPCAPHHSAATHIHHPANHVGNHHVGNHHVGNHHVGNHHVGNHHVGNHHAHHPGIVHARPAPDCGTGQHDVAKRLADGIFDNHGPGIGVRSIGPFGIGSGAIVAGAGIGLLGIGGTGYAGYRSVFGETGQTEHGGKNEGQNGGSGHTGNGPDLIPNIPGTVLPADNVIGTPVPEPSSIVLFAMVTVIIILMRKIQRTI